MRVRNLTNLAMFFSSSTSRCLREPSSALGPQVVLETGQFCRTRHHVALGKCDKLSRETCKYSSDQYMSLFFSSLHCFKFCALDPYLYCECCCDCVHSCMPTSFRKRSFVKGCDPLSTSFTNKRL